MGIDPSKVTRVVIGGNWYTCELGTFKIAPFEFVDERGPEAADEGEFDGGGRFHGMLLALLGPWRPMLRQAGRHAVCAGGAGSLPRSVWPGKGRDWRLRRRRACCLMTRGSRQAGAVR